MESVRTIMGKIPPTDGTLSLWISCLTIRVQLIRMIGIKITHRILPMTVNTLCLTVCAVLSFAFTAMIPSRFLYLKLLLIRT